MRNLDQLLRPKIRASITNDLCNDVTIWRILYIYFNLGNIILNNFGTFLNKIM